ncbi:MAG: MgtC/SapB family protein, partial [Burkholderiales bacterium]|nr:MgtC/SapB family protein [Burkholderiales bacterium]
MAVALGIGLLVGAERERRKREGPMREPAGVRTFAVASLLGAVGMALGGALVTAALALGVAILLGAAYWRNADEDPGLTTETAVLLTLVLGALAMREPALAGGLAVALAVLLASRAHLHRFVRSVLSEREMNDFLVLAAATLVVLPLVPNRYVGPFGAINPHVIWLIVVLVMAIGAAGHVALRSFGARVGLPVAGFVGGFVSSTATVAAMGERCARTPSLLRPAIAGAVMSSVATVVLMTIILVAMSPSTLVAMALPLACSGAAALAYGALFMVRSLRDKDQPAADERGAFSIKAAFAFAATLAVVLVAVAGLKFKFGDAGLIAAAGIAGFADAPAALVSTVSLVASGKL